MKIKPILFCVFALLLISVTIMGVIRKESSAAKERLRIETERQRVIDNVYKTLQSSDGKVSAEAYHVFFSSLGVEPKITINTNYDGSFNVVLPSFRVTKEQLEKYSADNVRWIDEK